MELRHFSIPDKKYKVPVYLSCLELVLLEVGVGNYSFVTEAQYNSEMTFWRRLCLLCLRLFYFSFLHLLRTFISLLDFQVELPGEVIDVSCGVDHMAAILQCS